MSSTKRGREKTNGSDDQNKLEKMQRKEKIASGEKMTKMWVRYLVTRAGIEVSTTSEKTKKQLESSIAVNYNNLVNDRDFVVQYTADGVTKNDLLHLKGRPYNGVQLWRMFGETKTSINKEYLPLWKRLCPDGELPSGWVPDEALYKMREWIFTIPGNPIRL
jgi:hypothetical protein